MKCDKCGSGRVLSVCGKTSDMCFVKGSVDGRDIERDDYVPGGVGIDKPGGGGDYLEFDYCLDCGKIQGKFPIPEKAVRNL